MGRRLRGLSLQQVQELLLNSFKGANNSLQHEIDLVICRNPVTSTNTINDNLKLRQQCRKISVDSFLSEQQQQQKMIESSDDDFASTAIK